MFPIHLSHWDDIRITTKLKFKIKSAFERGFMNVCYCTDNWKNEYEEYEGINLIFFRLIKVSKILQNSMCIDAVLMQFDSYIVLNQTRTSICERNLWDGGGVGLYSISQNKRSAGQNSQLIFTKHILICQKSSYIHTVFVKHYRMHRYHFTNK